jgi:hypothetical protein
VVTFAAIADRVTSGEPYYRAQGEVLRARNYPTAHVFNWRTPLLLVSIAKAPWVARGLLIALGALSCFLMLFLLRPAAVAGWSGILQLGNFVVTTAPNAMYMSEVWAGGLIVLSLCAYFKDARVMGALLGGLALFVRELAAPYCVVCGIMSLIQRRWAELAVWIAAAGLYGIYFWRHSLAVLAHQTPDAMAHPQAWLQLGGLGFLLSLVDSHTWFLGAPKPVLIGGLSLIVLGILHARTPAHLRVASATYAAFFLVVGQSFNTYWGYLAWPTWAMVSGYGLQELIEGARDAQSA